jgi:hypothetical protein
MAASSQITAAEVTPSTLSPLLRITSAPRKPMPVTSRLRDPGRIRAGAGMSRAQGDEKDGAWQKKMLVRIPEGLPVICRSRPTMSPQRMERMITIWKSGKYLFMGTRSSRDRE